MMRLLLISTFILLVFCENSCFAQFSCKKDGGGSDVDWFIALKLPELPSKHQFKREGTAYVYMDNENAGNGLKLSSYSVNDKRSAMGATLTTIYDKAKSQSYNTFVRIFYNDQPPYYKDQRITKKPSSSYGHSKGAIAYDTNGGFWLIHSTPRYPSVTKSRYMYPGNGKRNGQAFFCANFNIQTFNKIAKHLLYVRPFIYDFNLPQNMKRSDTRAMTQLIENIKANRVGMYPPKGSGLQNDVKFTLSTLKGTNLFSYAKNAMRSGLMNHIASANLVTLYAETWVRGGSYVSGSVVDVQQVTVLGESYKSSKDHSKYLVAGRTKRKNFPQIYLVCIGDLNRMTSQLVRGGGYLCIKDSSVWETFFKIVNPDNQPKRKRPRTK